MELPIYNITFKWVSDTQNNAADCLLQLVDVKYSPVISNTSINIVVTSTQDGHATHTHGKTLTPTDATPSADVKPTSASNTDTFNVPFSHRGIQGHSLAHAEDRSLQQMHLKMATE